MSEPSMQDRIAWVKGLTLVSAHGIRPDAASYVTRSEYRAQAESLIDALAQQLADVAYLAEWMRGDNARIHWDAFSGAYFADGHPEDGAEDLPALGALLRQREVGR